MRSQPQLELLIGQQTSPLHTPVVPLLCVQLCPPRDVNIQLAFAPHTAVWHWLLLPHWVPMGSGGNVQPLGLHVLAVRGLKSSQPACETGNLLASWYQAGYDETGAASLGSG